MSISSISSERTAPCLTLSKDARNTPAPHGTSGFSHFFTPMCNRQRQAVSDGINSESEYSGGQWFLNHLCDWNTLPSSLCGNNTLVTQIEAETFQQGLCQLKKKNYVYFVYQEMAGYLEDGWQLHCDDKVFMRVYIKWLSIKSRRFSYMKKGKTSDSSQLEDIKLQILHIFCKNNSNNAIWLILKCFKYFAVFLF